jgi:hypothetical protein
MRRHSRVGTVMSLEATPPCFVSYRLLHGVRTDGKLKRTSDVCCEAGARAAGKARLHKLAGGGGGVGAWDEAAQHMHCYHGPTQQT